MKKVNLRLVLGGILAVVAVIIGGTSVIYNINSGKSEDVQQTSSSEKTDNKNDDKLTNNAGSVDENNPDNSSSSTNNGSSTNDAADNSGFTTDTNINSYNRTAKNTSSPIDNSSMSSRRSSDFYVATSQNTRVGSKPTAASIKNSLPKIIKTFEKKIEDIKSSESEKSSETNNNSGSNTDKNSSKNSTNSTGKSSGVKIPSSSENVDDVSEKPSDTGDGSGRTKEEQGSSEQTGKGDQSKPGQTSEDNPATPEKSEGTPEQNNYRETASIYAWGDYTMVYGEAAQNVYATLKSLKVNAVYQSISNMNDTENLSKIVSGYKNNGIDVYRLIGHYSWAYDNVNDAKRYVDDINSYNQKVNESSKIKGVVFDIEPHQNPNWKHWNDEQRNAAVSKYTDNMTELYNYSKQYGLEVVICIPYWFEKFDSFDRLFKDAADTYSVMNYTKRGIVRHISEEVAEAEKYGKKVEQISNVGHVGSEDITSYRNDGMQKLLDDQKQILDTYPYSGLRVSFHQYKTILDIL